jgi:hypothetical protein
MQMPSSDGSVLITKVAVALYLFQGQIKADGFVKFPELNGQRQSDIPQANNSDITHQRYLFL